MAIILVIEHIAIAKAMGRQFNYTINPSQEIVALGAANMFSPFVGGYVCTGSFGASAVLSKAGVRTPFAGVFSALVLVLALYVLTGVFFFIPNAALAGLIIHAVCNLVTPPKNLYKYWQLSPIELIIWIIGVALALFDSLEISIYVGMALSLLVMLIRIARTKGQFLGRVHTRRVVQRGSNNTNEPKNHTTDSDAPVAGQYQSRDVYLPLNKLDACNPRLIIDSPYPGVFIYRFNESYNYTNQARHVMLLVEHIMQGTRRRTEEYYEKESDRLWNDPGPKKHEDNDHLPYLRALVFDFAAVNNIDITAVQGLVDLRDTLDRHCAPDAVELHFANVRSRWARRALAAAGFGYPSAKNAQAVGYWRPAYTLAAVLGDHGDGHGKRSAEDEESRGQPHVICTKGLTDRNDSNTMEMESHSSVSREACVYGVDRPFFHIDLHEAVEAAVADARRRDGWPAECVLESPNPSATSS